MEGNRKTVRVDVGYILKTKDGDILYLREIKNGPFARYTQNQGDVYPFMLEKPHIPVYPKGQNADFIFKNFGVRPGEPFIKYEFDVIKY